MNSTEIGIERFFDEDEVETMARETGFVIRNSPVTGMRFLLTFTTGLMNTPDGTLSQLAAFLGMTCGAAVAPQAVDERIKATAKQFMGLCLCRALKMSAAIPRGTIDALDRFDHVYVIDSTNFELHPTLAPRFKGSGGGASAASMRIQFVFDYCSGIMHVEIGDVRLADTATLERLVREQKLPMDGICLLLADLGYFKLSTFAAIRNCCNHHFLSKLQFGVALTDIDGGRLDLQGILKRKPDQFSLNVNMGGTVCRLVGKRLSDEIAGQKIRRANKSSESKSGQISDEYRLFLHYALFVTSLPNEFGMPQLFALYRIRWQVELVFKVWKSILAIHKIRSAKIDRVFCEVYGKLILAVITSTITATSRALLEGVVISQHKAARHIKTVVANWALAIMDGPAAHRKFLNSLMHSLVKLCRKTRQKSKPIIEDILAKELSLLSTAKNP